MHSAAKIRKPNREGLRQVGSYFSDIMRILEGANPGLMRCLQGPTLLSSHLHYPLLVAFVLMVVRWLHLRQEEAEREKVGQPLDQESKSFF